MKIPSKIASGALILIGFGWLSSVLWPSRGWSDRTVNQMPSNAQEGVPTQNFTPPQGQNSFTDDGSAVGTDAAEPSEPQSVRQTGQAVPSSTQSASPSPTNIVSPAASPSPAAVSPSPTASPSPAVSPSPTVVPEPIRAGW